MWQAISNVLTSKNASNILWSIIIAILIAAIMTKTGMLKIKTKHVSMTASDLERTVIREQCDWVHTYIKGLEGKIVLMENDQNYNEYFVKYILECIYDEVVKWITFNHIQNTDSYIHTKQMKITSLVYSFNLQEQFKNKEFTLHMHAWVKEAIEELIKIRELYGM